MKWVLFFFLLWIVGEVAQRVTKLEAQIQECCDAKN